MKTMEFVRQDIWKGQYFCGAGFPSSANEIAKDVSGTYVLAAEVNERIKVLEDALKTSLELCREIQSSHKASIGSLYSHYTPQLRVSTVTGQAAIISAALEVK